MKLRGRKPIAQRSKNLTDDAIEQIVRLLDSWSGRLTWEALIDAIVTRLHCRYTRQALHRHERIKMAYTLRKEVLGQSVKDGVPRCSGQLGEAMTRISRLEAENCRLEAENRRLLEQFVVWAYNAHARGLDKSFLSQPLPSVNRGKTVSTKQAPPSGKKRA